MALSTGLVHGGNQEQKVFAIDDVIKDKDKAARPFSTGAPKKGNPKNDLFHIMSKTFVTGEERSTAEATTLTNKRVENRKQIGARLHHIEEAVEVGMVTQGNETYGSNGLSEYERQRKEVLEDQLKSWERVFCGNTNCQAGSSSVAFKTRGAGLWISPSSTSLAGDSETDISDASHRTPAASIVDLHIDALTASEVTNRMTAATLNGIMGSLFDVCGGPGDYDVICTRALKEMVSSLLNIDKVVDGLTKVARYNGDIEMKRLGFVVEIYVGDTGTLTFKMSTFLPVASGGTSSTEAFILNWDFADIYVRTQPGFYPVDNVSLSKKTAIAGTQGLAMVPRYHGKITRAAA